MSDPIEVGKIDPDPFPGYENAGAHKDADFPAHGPSSEGYPLTPGHVRRVLVEQNVAHRPVSEGLRLQDSGQRVQTPTGAVRERRPGKGRYDLISPVVEERLAKHMEAGAEKYKDGRNWEKGLPLSWYVDGTKRHLGQFLRGETDEDHLAAALWNLHCLLHTEEMIRRGAAGHTPELNDLPGTRGAYGAAPPTHLDIRDNTSTRTVVHRLGVPTVPALQKFCHTTKRLCHRVPGGSWTVVEPGAAPDDLVPIGVPCQLPHPEPEGFHYP